MASQLPYPIYGIVYDTDGTTAVSSATVRARNETTNELITVTSESNGQYVLDAANFASGYLETDKVTIYVIYHNADGEGTISIADDEHENDITLVEVTDSSLIYYCTVQDVYDDLEISETDITAQKVIKAIQRAEARIEERTQTKFRSVTITEYQDFNQYTGVKSPEQLSYIGYTGRRDYWNINYNNKFKLNYCPVISITSLYKNTAAASLTDSWTLLTEQSGSGGDFEVDLPTGWITFILNVPRYGKRAIKVTYTYGYSSTPKNVSRLAIMLAIEDLIRNRAGSSQFINSQNITMGELSISNTSGQAVTYLSMLKKDIDEAWNEVGTMIADLA